MTQSVTNSDSATPDNNLDYDAIVIGAGEQGSISYINYGISA